MQASDIDKACISTHAPRTGSDRYHLLNLHSVFQFQPTLPARGATSSLSMGSMGYSISTHAPRTGSDAVSHGAILQIRISTHAPRTGSDVNGFNTEARSLYFNPRSPHGERRASVRRKNSVQQISTHAPRTGSDHEHPHPKEPESPISTHAPRTGSDLRRRSCQYQDCTISTHAPRTGSDRLHRWRRIYKLISTHAPRTGSDMPPTCARNLWRNFNPRSPHGERPSFFVSLHV